MSRYAAQHAGGNKAVTLSVLDSIASKEANYMEKLRHNHGLCKTAASRLTDGVGEVERVLMSLASSGGGAGGDDDNDNDEAVISVQEVQEFLLEQRERLKRLSEKNAETERMVTDFVSSVKRLRHDVAQGNIGGGGEDDGQQGADGGGEEDFDFELYENKIREYMEKERIEKGSSRVDLRQETFCRQIREALGEKDDPAENPGRRSRGGGGEDDDDIEVVHNGNNAGGGSGRCLKCPVTQTYMTDPVKSKLCGHSYSREGIFQMLRNKKFCKCPVPGCNNAKLTEDQLEQDVETAIAVRRDQRRQDTMKQMVASQADDLVDSDEDE